MGGQLALFESDLVLAELVRIELKRRGHRRPRPQSLDLFSWDGPMVRPSCDTGVWPCRYTKCRHCLAQDARRERPGQSWCVLAVTTAYPDGAPYDAIGLELGIGQERARQLVVMALASAYEAAAEEEVEL